MGIFRKILNFSPFGILVYTRKFPSSEKKIDYQERFLKFDIGKDEKVLDLGSGGEPFKYATHLLDYFPGKTQHRYNELKTNGLPFVVGDIQQLPYKDKTFDFVYSAHVIEHIDNPELACEEMMRVASRGYIEVPTRMSDIMFNFARMNHFHKWHISIAGNTLIFSEYNDWERKDTGDVEFFKIAHSMLPNSLKKAYRKNKNLYTNMFLWKDHFNYFVFDKLGNLISSNYKK